MKKITYFFAVLIVSAFIVSIYCIFVMQKPAAPDHAALPLTPGTAREQQDVIAAQEQKATDVNEGPLVEKVSPTTAQARVLNLVK